MLKLGDGGNDHGLAAISENGGSEGSRLGPLFSPDERHPGERLPYFFSTFFSSARFRLLIFIGLEDKLSQERAFCQFSP